MNVTGMKLAWIVVKDLQSAIKFYEEIVGLTLQSHNPEYGWAELSGPEGLILGIAQENSQMEVKAGENAIVTVTVKDIEKARDAFLLQGAKLIGDIVEVPGHVKMQTFTDKDGNVLQLVQMLEAAMTV